MKTLRRYPATLTLACGALLAACAERPVPPPSITSATSSLAAKQTYIIVQRGQSLDQIARTFRVPKAEIIAANKLAPPYHIKPGAALAIPGTGPLIADEPTVLPKAGAPLRPAATPERVATVRPTPRPVSSKAAPPGAKPAAPEVIPLD
jgi:LysM repeat protein